MQVKAAEAALRPVSFVSSIYLPVSLFLYLEAVTRSPHLVPRSTEQHTTGKHCSSPPSHLMTMIDCFLVQSGAGPYVTNECLCDGAES